MALETTAAPRETDQATILGVKAIPLTMPDILGEELNFLVVRVEVDGAVGFGEICDSYCCTFPLAYVTLVEEVLGGLVTGEPLEPLDLLIRRLNWYVRRRLGDHGMVKQAISGIEIALWDALGKHRGQSVARMLGQARAEVPVYASGKFLNEGSPEYCASSSRSRSRAACGR